MKKYIYPGHEELKQIVKRPSRDAAEIKAAAAEIMNAVRSGGDKTVRDLTRRFDGYAGEDLKIDDDEIRRAEDEVPEELRKAIGIAVENIGLRTSSGSDREGRHLRARRNRAIVLNRPDARCPREARGLFGDRTLYASRGRRLGPSRGALFRLYLRRHIGFPDWGRAGCCGTRVRYIEHPESRQDRRSG